MAKASAHEIAMVSCPSCWADLLISKSVDQGDKFKCPICNKKHTIETITRDYRDKAETLTAVEMP